MSNVEVASSHRTELTGRRSATEGGGVLTGHDEADREAVGLYGCEVWAIDPIGAARDSPIELYWNHADALARAAMLETNTTGILVVPLILRGERRRCRLCGEPVAFEDPDDPMSCYHSEDANDDGKHSAEV